MPRAAQRLKTRKPAAVKPAGPAYKAADALAGCRLVRYMEEHFEWLLVSGYSPETIRARRQAIRKFIAWADERGLDDPREVTRPMIERYQRHLFYYRKPDTPKGRKDAGAALTVGMQVQYLAPLKTWFRWLAREHHILANPAADIDLPRQPKRLPRSVPGVQEVEAMLAEAEPTNAQGVRDRALLEVLYATGLHRMEIVGVAIYDVDLPRGLLWVAQGQGQSSARGAHWRPRRRVGREVPHRGAPAVDRGRHRSAVPERLRPADQARAGGRQGQAVSALRRCGQARRHAPAAPRLRDAHARRRR